MTQVQPNRRQYDQRRSRKNVWDIRELNDAEPEVAGYQSSEVSLPGGRVLGIDYGERRVGLAISDPTGRIAHGLDTINATSPDDVLDAIGLVVATFDVRKIIVGLPVNMDGTMGEMAARVIEFARVLSDRTDAQVITWDERLTSLAAQRAIIEMGQSLKRRKKDIDRISATIILQGYLDSVRQVHASTGPATEEHP